MGKKENIFAHKLETDQFVITSEVSPPKGTNANSVFKYLKDIKNQIDAVNVTDQQSSIMRLGSLTMSYFLLKKEYEPIYQITCRDRNRIALESDLLSAYSLGIKNILVLTGDHPIQGDHPQAKPVFDLDSVQLLKVISKLNSGIDMVGNELNGKVDFFVGAVVNPGVEPLDPELIKMKKKIEAGAKFFQTQAIYDIKKLDIFLNRIENINIPVIIGIIPLKSVKMANYINCNLAGISVPEHYIRRLDKSDNKEEESVKITVELIEEIKGRVAGIHLMPINWPEVVKKILDRLNQKTDNRVLGFH